MKKKLIDFGKTANDYRKYRHGFPEKFFSYLFSNTVKIPSKVLDLGTGTGTVARGFAKAGFQVTALDPSKELIEQAIQIDYEENIHNIDYIVATAENTNQPHHYFDIITAGQCWHWFDSLKTIKEIKQILKPHGKLIIAYYDWIPLPYSVPAITEALILKYNPTWSMANGNGFYPQWVNQLLEAEFMNIETYSFDTIDHYSHEAWRGRIRASAGVAASLNLLEVKKFDIEHAAILSQKFPEETLKIPHRCFTIIANESDHYKINFSICKKEIS